MHRKSLLCLAAAACAVPFAALAQGQQTAQPDLVVITVTPVDARTMDLQRRESMFRTMDSNADGQVSMAEAGVNAQLVNAFKKLDRNSDGSLDRQEFARVHVDDGSRSSAASGASTPQEKDPRDTSMTSRSIEERAKFNIPGERGVLNQGDKR